MANPVYLAIAGQFQILRSSDTVTVPFVFKNPKERI